MSVSEVCTLPDNRKVSNDSEVRVENGKYGMSDDKGAKELVISDTRNPAIYPHYWLKIRVGSIEFAALLDPGAARTVLGVGGE